MPKINEFAFKAKVTCVHVFLYMCLHVYMCMCMHYMFVFICNCISIIIPYHPFSSLVMFNFE